MINDSMAAFLELCDPRRDSLTTSASDIPWENISGLSKLHGVTSFLFYRTRQLGIPVPEKIRKEWLGIYLYSLAQDQKARRQIKELKEILDPAGVPFILLKGASAMLRLYPEPGLRTFVDIDILISVDQVSLFKKAMLGAGYKPAGSMNSAEDEEVYKFEGHLDPFSKEGNFSIEPHLNILNKGPSNYSIALPEIWKRKDKGSSEDLFFHHLAREDFLIHTLLHSGRHFLNSGLFEMKGIIDVLFLVKNWKLDWSSINLESKKWRIEEEILSLATTLNFYWDTDIPVTEGIEVPDINTLLLGVEDPEIHEKQKIPSTYLKRFLKLGNLPDRRSRFMYLFHLFFPQQKNLRWRYNVSLKRMIFPYYCLHLFYTLKKFLIGLFHQLLYRPKTT